jgi:hypothetical protein
MKMPTTIEGTAKEITPAKPTGRMLPEAEAARRVTYALDSSLYSLCRQVQKAEAFDQVADLHWQIKLVDKQLDKLTGKPAGKGGALKASITEMSLKAEKKALADTMARLIERIKPMGV